MRKNLTNGTEQRKDRNWSLNHQRRSQEDQIGFTPQKWVKYTLLRGELDKTAEQALENCKGQKASDQYTTSDDVSHKCRLNYIT